MKYLFYTTVIFIVLLSCSKENRKACWQGWSPLLYKVPCFVQSDKTKEEAKVGFPDYYFSRQEETNYCWRANQTGDYFIGIVINRLLLNSA